MRIIYSLSFLLLLILPACVPSPEDERETDALPPIYPDYAGVMAPCNIAPLNFMLRDSCEVLFVTAESDGYSIKSHKRGNEALFDLKEWKKLMERATQKTVSVSVSALRGGKWIKYRPFDIYVSADSIDPYLTYRLIEPDYEVFSMLSADTYISKGRYFIHFPPLRADTETDTVFCVALSMSFFHSLRSKRASLPLLCDFMEYPSDSAVTKSTSQLSLSIKLRGAILHGAITPA